MKRLCCSASRLQHVQSSASRALAAGSLTDLRPKRLTRAQPTIASQRHLATAVSENLGYPNSLRDTVVNLLSKIGSQQEVRQYLNRFRSVASQQFAVIKVGGDILTHSLEEVCQAISNLYKLGLYPVIVHGGGPQLNELLKEAGVDTEKNWHEGIRVTDLKTLSIAWKLFNEENLRFVKCLDKYGVKAMPSLQGVLTAEFLDKDKWQYVGKITEVNSKPLEDALNRKWIPVLTSMAVSKEGQYLNVNADVAAAELARALKPLKIVYLSEKGGLFNEKKEIISEIDLDTQYDDYMRQPWVKHGTKLKIKEMKQLLDTLPGSTSVAIIDPKNLEKELFTESGAGTLIKRGIRPEVVTSLDQIKDISAFQDAILQGRRGTAAESAIPNNLEALPQQKFTAYVNEHKEGVAIVHHPIQEGGPAYLSTFNFSESGWLNGPADMTFKYIKKDFPKLVFMTSTANKDLNQFIGYADGFKRAEDGVLFWSGLKTADEIAKVILSVQENGAKMFNQFLQPNSSSSKTTAIPLQGSHVGQQQSRKYSTMPRSTPFTSARPRSLSAFSRASPLSRQYSTTTNSTNPNPPFDSSRKTRTEPCKIALIGARGYTGQALIELLDKHPLMDLRHVSSRELNGKPLEGYKKRQIVYQNLYPEDVERMAEQGEVDCWVMALPNGVCSPFVEAVDAGTARSKKKGDEPSIVVDLSADFRFDSNWTYGLPELKDRETLAKAKRISNPGCYATAAQLGIAPLLDVIGGQPTVFGVSGYSGAGTKPSPKNDVEVLKDNLIAYSLTDHIHEKEVSKQLGTEVAFIPHVASWFQGIHHTISVPLSRPIKSRDVRQLFQDRYAGEPLVKVVGESPLVKNISGRHGVEIGGFAVHSGERRVVVNVTIDNLLKGAATQCLQNMNLALGCAEFEGIKVM